MHKKLKEAVGIDIANCSTCSYRGFDDDGNFPEYSVSWPVCDKFSSYVNLKSFPFKKEMPCWDPCFWHSKFAEQIKTGETEEVKNLMDQFVAAKNAA